MEVIAATSLEKVRLDQAGGALIFGYYRAGGIFVPIASDVNGNLGVAGAAGSNTTAIDQTTPGTTNGVSVRSVKGAANLATGQVALSTTAATAVVARPTRRGVTLKNLDAAITIYYGPATVTAGNGMELKPGESTVVTWVGLIQAIAASGTPTIAVADEYD